MTATGDLSLLASLAHMLGQEVNSSRMSAESSGVSSASSSKVTYCSATCLDQQCKNKLFFPHHEASVVCPDCGQRHSVADLTDRTVLGEEDQRFGVEASQLRKKHFGSKKTAEQIKVNGVSNFQCKLLSPLLSTYGMDKDDHPCRLKELGMGDMFDCSKLSCRSFSIEENHLQVLGYGLDCSGSQLYLKDILSQLREVNGGQENLAPLHADGDGHCLVHAISRCLVGRELFWHALRSNLHAHLSTNLERYRELFKDFYSQEEWEGLVAEAAPDWKPPDGQSLGLSNIHIYGLANVLRRPIILLDSLDGMHSSGDYSGIFLPSMFTPEECSYKDAGGVCRLNPPLVIAWSSSGRNHFIPLIPVKGKPLPKLPPSLLPKVWGVGGNLLQKYVSVCEDGSVEVCGGKELGKQYLLRLIKCMDQLFLDKHKVSPSLVGDVDLYVFKASGCVGVATDTTVGTTYKAVLEGRLYRCLVCSAISIIPLEWLQPRGLLYEKAAREDKLQDGNKLTFPFDGITARYEAAADTLIPTDVNCFCCSLQARRVQGNGSIIFENGDRTHTPAVKSRCGCGYKHYWDGQEYDNLPEKIPLSLNWNGKIQPVVVHWFQYESDPERNSNVFQVANKVVSDEFPGEFGSERLVQQVVDQILKATASSTPMERVTGHHPSKNETTPTTDTRAAEVDVPASKMILTGAKSRTLHKEELNMSEAEKHVRRRVQDNARQAQSKKRTKYSPSSQDAPHRKTTPPPQKTTPPPQKTTPPKVPSSQKRVRVTTSDGRTCNLCLENSVTYAQLLDTIEKELSIPANQQKLRSGFPPRELVPPSDPALPVDLANGEKVSVDILPAVTTEANTEDPPTMEVGVAGKDATQAEELLETADTLNTLLQQLLGKEVDLWGVAQHQPQHFHKGGDFYRQVLQQYGDQVQHNAHIQFKELPRKTFVFNAEKECLELCLGVKHIPVRPLTAEEELTVAAAAREDGMSTTPTSSALNSGGGVVRPTASQHVKAFSGKGHTLSSPASSSARPTAVNTSSNSRLLLEAAAPGNSARYVPRRGRADSSERLGAPQSVGAQLDLAQRLDQDQNQDQVQDGSPEENSSRLRLLQDRELSLQSLVFTLKNKLLEISVSPGTDSQQVLLGLVDQLQKAQTNLDKVRGELAELTRSSC